MVRTTAKPRRPARFRGIVLSVRAELRDLRGSGQQRQPALAPDNYRASQELGETLRGAGSDGVVYPSIRHVGGVCVGPFYPDCAPAAVQGRHLDYHWDGARVDLVRDAACGEVLRVVDVS